MRLMNMLEKSFAAVAFAERGLDREAVMIMRGADQPARQAGPVRSAKVQSTPRPRVRA